MPGRKKAPPRGLRATVRSGGRTLDRLQILPSESTCEFVCCAPPTPRRPQSRDFVVLAPKRYRRLFLRLGSSLDDGVVHAQQHALSAWDSRIGLATRQPSNIFPRECTRWCKPSNYSGLHL